ncbi:oxygen-independent coproporphyrinogen III oxidase [Sphingomonas sp. 37zxx]|uniref:oxygen-independent coproporphyrinogen III oxidase n=1 Tax=Sphingomonas sp. 37zxx TaxID=1550073 RepID=UPI00053BEF1E|nr:oxygen-independent coproporphyrinogen III oxidase [Sphingomonas sp. 37zxx]
MHVFLPEIADQSVPRYTSYPTAMAFTPAVGSGQQAAALAALTAETTASIYIHIPYCHQICWYCGCNTGAIGKVERLATYVAALVREIETVGRRFPGRVTAVHFGGGSPNALSTGLFALVCHAIRASFSVSGDAEWAAELDPRHLDESYAQGLAAAGISRVSLGAQTFAPQIQARINRIQPFRQVARSAAAMRAAGIERINLDLMYGLPGQTLDDIAATIAQALLLRPDRIAMFGYAHLPLQLPRQRMIDSTALPTARERFWQSALAHDLLTEAGYDPVGFDHFARHGDGLSAAARTGELRRNFQGFTDDPADVVLGIGASAISHFPDLIVQNEKHVGSWRMRAANGQLTGVRGVERDADDRLRGAIIERLLCQGEADISTYIARHGEPAIDQLEALGVVRRITDRIEITDIGWPYARIVAAAFDSRRSVTLPLSRAV